jgi:hypothetical protein
MQMREIRWVGDWHSRLSQHYAEGALPPVFYGRFVRQSRIGMKRSDGPPTLHRSSQARGSQLISSSLHILNDVLDLPILELLTEAF